MLDDTILFRICYFVEVLFFAWLSKIVGSVILRRNFDKDLTEKDNPAAAIFIASFYLAIFISLSQILALPDREFISDVRDIAIHSSIIILLLSISMYLWRPFYKIHVVKDIFEGKRTAAAVVCGAVAISTGLIYTGTTYGEGTIDKGLIFFVLGQFALFVMSLLYQLITPYDIYKEVTEKNNLACGFGFAGLILGFGIILGNAAKGDFQGWERSLREFVMFASPVIALIPVRFVICRAMFLGMRDINKEISEDRNIAAGLVEGTCYLGIALLIVSLI